MVSVCFALFVGSLEASQSQRADDHSRSAGEQSRSGDGMASFCSFQHLSSDSEAEVVPCLTEVPFVSLCFCLCQPCPGARNSEINICQT